MIALKKTEPERLEEFLRENFRLDQRIEAINNRKLYSLEIELTRRCNLECIYCYNSSSRNPGTSDFDFNLLERILREAYEYGIRSITYLGGEPTLHPAINEIIKFTKDIGMEEVVLYTNGTMMNDRLLESINAYVDAVVFHMDTVSRDIFADLHNIEREASFKYFDAILDNLHMLLLSGYQSKKLRHCMTLYKATYETLEQTLAWAIHDENMLTSVFIPLVEVGGGAKFPESEKLDLHKVKRSYELRANIEQRSELLLLGPSEYCKQYQLTTAYMSCDGLLLPYAGYLGKSTCSIHMDTIGNVIAEHYAFLTFDYDFKCDDLNEHKEVTRCINSTFCFGTRTAYNVPTFANGCDPNCWIQDKLVINNG